MSKAKNRCAISRRAFAASLACGVIFTSSACGALGRSLPTYRYRLTLEVETPEGLRTGSSVIEIRAQVADRPILPDANALNVQVTGEAVTVDLGKRGLLFALLRSEEAAGWAGGVMELVTPRPPHVDGENAYVTWHKAMLANKGLHELPRNAITNQRPWRNPKPGDPPKDYPMLVRFKDVSDPATVERVDPDDLATSFGARVNLRRITVELTDDPVTAGIEMKLGWLGRTKGALVHVPVSDYPPAGVRLPFYATLTELDFIQGGK